MKKWMPPRNSGEIPHVSTRFSLSMEMNRLTRDGTVETVSRGQISGTNEDIEKIIFPVQLTSSRIGKPYPVDPYPCYVYVLTILPPALSTCAHFIPLVGVGKRGAY